MVLLGLDINDDSLPTIGKVEELFTQIRTDLTPENLENAFMEEEWMVEGPSIRENAKFRPAPEGTVSYQIWKETSNELNTLEIFYRKLLVAKDLDLAPGDLFRVFRYLEIRLTKLLRVLNPRYTIARVTNLNKNPQTHFVIRAHWFDNMGVEKRSVNKVYHNVEHSFKDRFLTFFEEQGFIVAEHYKMKVNHDSTVIHDLVLMKKDKKLILELKPNQCAKLFIRFSLWKIYKEEYYGDAK